MLNLNFEKLQKLGTLVRLQSKPSGQAVRRLCTACPAPVPGSRNSPDWRWTTSAKVFQFCEVSVELRCLKLVHPLNAIENIVCINQMMPIFNLKPKLQLGGQTTTWRPNYNLDPKLELGAHAITWAPNYNLKLETWNLNLESWILIKHEIIFSKTR